MDGWVDKEIVYKLRAVTLRYGLQCVQKKHLFQHSVNKSPLNALILVQCLCLPPLLRNAHKRFVKRFRHYILAINKTVEQ